MSPRMVILSYRKTSRSFGWKREGLEAIAGSVDGIELQTGPILKNPFTMQSGLKHCKIGWLLECKHYDLRAIDHACGHEHEAMKLSGLANDQDLIELRY